MPALPAGVAKVVHEGSCRVCHRMDIETAHLWPRGRGAPQYDEPDIVIPLCKYHHRLLDEHRLDLLAYLSTDEQVATVKYAGGILKALNRLTVSAD